MNDDRKLNELIDRHLDQRLDPAGRAELEARLWRDVDSRRRFWERAEMDGLLQEWGRMQSGVEEIVGQVHARSSRWSLRHLLPHPGVAVAALVVLGAWFGIHLTSPSDQATVRSERPVTGRDAVAVMIHDSDARWQKSAPAPGDFVAIGDLTLLSGAAGFEFASGGMVTIGAPARIRITSANAIDCKEGQVTVQRPADSEPFSIMTPAGIIADIQNQVAMQVNLEGTDLLAAKGSASIRLKSGQQRAVPQGDGIRVGIGGIALAADTTKLALAAQAQIAEHLHARRSGPTGRWRILSQRQNEDPDLLVRYTFEPAGPDKTILPNQAAGHDGLPEGQITGGRFGEGSRPGKSALFLAQPRDGIQFALPGSYGSMTMAMRIFIDNLDHEYNSLCMSTGINPGGLHWQIHRSGRLETGVFGQPANPPYKIHASPPVLVPNSFGAWRHLAVVYDSHEGSVSHYLDGNLVSISPMGDSQDIQIGEAMIGNWDPFRADDSNKIRFLHGRIDDFAIYRRALTAREIGVLHGLGQR